MANTVVDGNARFTVLTSRLVRTEYAEDGQFQDATTFNAIKRSFPAVAYTTRVNNGWREIQTADLLMRYKENSGAFSPTNLTVQLQGQSLPPSAQSTPIIPDWGLAAMTPCMFSQTCEAENATLSGGEVIRSDHQNASGTGFVADYGVKGATTTWTLHDVPVSGNETLAIRYANSTGGDGQATARTLSLYVNGSKTGTITLPTTANWDTWGTVRPTAQLQAGDNTIALVCEAGDSCNVNIDTLTIQETCMLGQICQGENAALTGGTTIASDHPGFMGTGFVAGYEQAGATTTWTVHNVAQESDAVLSMRYANFRASDSQITSRTLSLSVNGGQASTVTFAPTLSWDSWSTITQKIHLKAGDNTIALSCGSGNSCRVNIDDIALTPPTAAPPQLMPANLGGWVRSLDQQSNALPLNNGLLSRDGWYLLDDSQTALWDTKGWPTPRPARNGAYQDGYFFGYGHQYEAALKDLAQLTGTAPLLPRWAFGNWYSRYFAYKDTDYEQTLLPKFRSERVPLDALVIDTDWKSPAQWNGWNWNTSLFPNAQAFLDWARAQGLHVTLNIHPSIQGDDPQFASTNQTAGGLTSVGDNRYVWDWSNQAQATSYMNLHHPFDKQGVRFWWLDWCCENSQVSMAGLNPDGWINYLYAKDATDQGLRGFAFSRMGSGYHNYANDSYTVLSGPWSNHRSTIQFTGDTQPTWEMLSFESAFTQKEGNIGQAYVTHDIGSFAGKHLSDDMYVRWIQLGTFQPIFRLHSDHGDRLPWDYDDAARLPAEQFMRLREALIPYLYTLSWQAYSTGLPMVRGLYLSYPEAPEAYAFDREYMLGDQMLVAPITTSGTTASTPVWFPPGTWTDMFTGKSYTGPTVQTITDDLTKMPVFIKAGGILPSQPAMDYATQKSVNPLTLDVYTGADGSFTLYEDSGEGLDYQSNNYALTPISYSQSQATVQIGAAQGHYAQQPTQRQYILNLINVKSAPSGVTVNGQPLNQASSGVGWNYDANAQTVHITLDQQSTQSALVIKLN
jgi:alpha-glucosidase (family GH31 glycosyl hydrolase)